MSTLPFWLAEALAAEQPAPPTPLHGHHEVDVGAVDAGGAGAQVGGHVLGAVNHAVQRICDNAHCFLLMIGVPISVLTEFSPFWELRVTEVMRAAA